ncbi:MAG: DUF2235 domain-containing protein [Prosthecobacter sp.]|uniref:DUF2235 domain-containing protein n=1 Tax=Prosthecobacter sp. TaxID=1965333 RepID=UPI0038FFA418
MSKNIIICIDGTNNEFREDNTNVVKLFQCLDLKPGVQDAYYTTGVGTFTATPTLTRPARVFQKVMGLAFGLGLTRSIQECYQFLMDHYEEGDRIFLFGFSRGAYAARALAGLIHRCGLLRPEHSNMISSAIHFYKHRAAKTLVDEFTKTFSRPCPIHFLGVWDTVSSVGWVWNPVVLSYTRENPSVITVRHAVAIDERRAFFRQNRWERSNDQDVKEVWFAGVHSDIGGGYEKEKSGLALLPLEWMLLEARDKGLTIDSNKAAKILSVPCSADPKADMHNSMTSAWRIAEFWPKWTYYAGLKRHLPRLNLFSRRFINPGVTVHESVKERMKQDYAPKNLPTDHAVEPWRRWA